MSESEFREVFARRLKYYLDLHEMAQSDLAKRLGVSVTSVSNWYNAIKVPRMDKIDKMCAIFNCLRKDLTLESSEDMQGQSYYTDPETARLAQEMFDDPDMRALHHMKRGMDPEIFKQHFEMMKREWQREHPEESDDFYGC